MPTVIKRVAIILVLTIIGLGMFLGDYTEYRNYPVEVVSVDPNKPKVGFKTSEGLMFTRYVGWDRIKKMAVGDKEILSLRGVDIKETFWGDFKVVLGMIVLATPFCLVIMWITGFTDVTSQESSSPLLLNYKIFSRFYIETE